jgi:hypothetical protein
MARVRLVLDGGLQWPVPAGLEWILIVLEKTAGRWASGIAGGTIAVLVLTAGALFLAVRGGDPYPIGGTTDLPEALYRSAPLTLVIVSRSSCGACQDAKPFFATLVSELKRARDSQTLLLTEQPAGEERVFAVDVGIPEDHVRSMDLRGLRVRRVPTLLLVDASGGIRFVKEGAPKAAEQEDWLREFRAAVTR